MRALQISAYGGDPLNVLELVDIPEPNAPGTGEVLIDVELAPLNMQNLLFMRGYFGALRHQLSLETRGSVGLQRLVLVLPTLRSATMSWRLISA